MRERRLNTPPTWKSSITRASLAAVFVFLFVLLTDRKHRIGVALPITVLALVVYIPAGYYLELALYRRRQRKKAAGR